ncbi:MAG: hypothetical protein CO186_01710 [Zetaproteobacteria bacterium CG_4_9_14_3_um_filter_49_83]|nr:MAG: hypothetical protein COW62_03935 [Zetaproteobacteria bacterium CG17_big_fil_post_rev_8_21_14_2_50_50_13]PIV30661.1 MAG: hypothetical protein COS35_05455 [Zetaproteobacteria bacterium CG02_land_8_20_14_3_00_50_9]PIY55774.1 MAG: hypothetical protein COZ00_07415 [Zetaproteobacteria bacterium CG_4_10_14_0_8_um_filter_49_80]PJA36154.1 MAG: hypothetical protein CO186_01710 [Zetaproteobacteria bacterium CG_4_9_14_3_um_filter_49_83]
MSFLNDIARKIAVPVSQHIEGVVQRAMSAHRQQMDDLMILQGRALAVENSRRAPLTRLQDAEFKVFSQFGEDGILQYLIHEAGIMRDETTFVEFGVQNYVESNTRFLLMNDHWRGMIIDGDKQYMDSVRNQDIYWRHDLTAVNAWIDRDNINQLIGDSGFSGQIGILSVDIDGNDYWVWERIEVVNPIIVVVEWNSVFGSQHSISVPYDPSFQREKAHYSNLFWGASISAFEHLGARKGYSLLGSNTVGNNLFFVRNDRLGRLNPLSSTDAYVESRFRDSRDANGKLNFLGGDRRCLEILDLPVVDVVSGDTVSMRTLDSLHD